MPLGTVWASGSWGALVWANGTWATATAGSPIGACWASGSWVNGSWVTNSWSAAGTGGGAVGGISRGQVVNNVMEPLKQSTARNIMVYLVQSSDGKTGATGLTLTITISKDGGAFASITPTVTERGNGWYNLALTTTHTNTLGDLAFHITGSGADPCDFKLPVEVELTGRLNYRSLLGFLDVVVGVGSTTTSVVLNASTGINGAAPSGTADFYKGAAIVFTTGTLAGQRTFVSAYSANTLTVVAMTGAPSNGDQGFLS